MMHTQPLSLNNPFVAANYQSPQGSLANNEDSQATFTLLFETVLALSNEQCSGAEIGTFGTPFETEGDSDGFQSGDDSSKRGSLFSSGIGRLTARADAGSVLPTSDASSRGPEDGHAVGALILDSTGERLRTSVQAAVLDCKPALPQSGSGSLDTSLLSDWMDAHALTRSSHHCAMYYRLGMEAAGLDTGDRPHSGDAGDYGPFLLRHGARIVRQDSYIPQVGDVVVFNKTGQHPFGHIEMYDGHHWVSDFMQHSLSPYRDAANAPPFTIYRLT